MAREQLKQRVDIVAAILFSVMMWGLAIDAAQFAAGGVPIAIDGWTVGFLIAVFTSPIAFAGLSWIIGRCFDRPDFNSLPSSKWVWGIMALPAVVGLIFGSMARSVLRV